MMKKYLVNQRFIDVQKDQGEVKYLCFIQYYVKFNIPPKDLPIFELF